MVQLNENKAPHTFLLDTKWHTRRRTRLRGNLASLKILAALKILQHSKFQSPEAPASGSQFPISYRQSLGQRPLAMSPRNVRQVLVEYATRSPLEFVTVHSTSPTVLPRCITRPLATKRSFHTGRRKLIFNSSVVNDSPSSSVEKYDMPIAASAISHSTPPCSVPIGLAWRDASASISMMASPRFAPVSRNPISFAIAGIGASPRIMRSSCSSIVAI